MRKTGQVTLAWLLIGLGVILMAGNFFQIDTDRMLWPLLMIGLGVILIVRPGSLKPETGSRFSFAGDYVLGKNWKLDEGEFYLFAGEFELDLTKIPLPPGETTIRINAFSSEIVIWAGKDIGIQIDAKGFVTNLEKDDREEESIFVGILDTSEGYQNAQRKLRLETMGFVSEIDIRRR
ncbi:MAG: cell wall-active antibiotics response protein [Anaerolineae bacterium]|nr:cell wall-active antibiotics response protein [Anaerolineae bacterium]